MNAVLFTKIIINSIHNHLIAPVNKTVFIKKKFKMKY
jgi:hypothetical protein